MALGQFFMGAPGRFERIQRFDPQRQQAFNQILSSVLPQILSGQLPMQGFEPIAEREVQRFQQETVPSLAERFTGMGAQRSSGFQEALARGGTRLGTDLAAMGSQFGLQRQSQLMQLLGMGLTPQEEIGYFRGQPGFMQGLAPGIGQGIGQAIPGALGALGGAVAGPIGGAIGSGLGALGGLLGLGGARGSVSV